MTTKTYAQLTAATDFQATDLLASWRPSGPGPLKSFTGAILATYFNTLYLQLSGSSAMTGTFLAFAGNESGPGIAFSSDPDTGFYSVSANSIGLSAGGMHVSIWTTAGQTINGSLTVSSTISSPTIDAINSSISSGISGLSTTASTVVNVSTSLTNVSTSLTNVSASVGAVTNVSTSVSQISSSLSTTNSTVANVSTSVTNVSSSLSTTNSTATNVSTSLSNVSTSLVNVSTSLLAVKYPIPATLQARGYTTVLADANTFMRIFSVSGTTVTIADSVAYPTGTFMTFVADSTGFTLAINNSAVLHFAGATGSRTVAAGGSVTVQKSDLGSSWWITASEGVT